MYIRPKQTNDYGPNLIVAYTEDDEPIYDEPKGCTVSSEYVKGNPKNNLVYVKNFLKIYPELWPIVWPLVLELEEKFPGYNIRQLKQKFFGIRFYTTPPEGISDEDKTEFRKLVESVEYGATLFWEQTGRWKNT